MLSKLLTCHHPLPLPQAALRTDLGRCHGTKKATQGFGVRSERKGQLRALGRVT